jgi:hypothetical protein
VCKQWLESLLTLREHIAWDLNKNRAKTWNGKWNGMKNGMFIDKLGYINLLDVITHIEIGKLIKCYSLTSCMIIPFHSIIRSVFYSIFYSLPCFNKHHKVCIYIQFFSPVFLPFWRLSGENNWYNLLISARS